MRRAHKAAGSENLRGGRKCSAKAGPRGKDTEMWSAHTPNKSHHNKRVQSKSKDF